MMPTPTISGQCPAHWIARQPGIASRPAPTISSSVKPNTMLSVESVRASRRSDTTAKA